ncbi:Uncharacterised protein [Mycobacteroides abscessus subsp. abscessus]|nr:Uncharacterised protein [Mycobacteroides abscessus subsp. abscessus]
MVKTRLPDESIRKNSLNCVARVSSSASTPMSAITCRAGPRRSTAFPA